jgi:hypothetical protein
MKQKLTLILALTLLATSAFSQKSKNKGTSDKKGPLVGLHFNLQDFVAPLGIKDPETGNVYSTVKDMTKGFSLSYWKGIHPKVDFAAKLNVSFRDYTAINA